MLAQLSPDWLRGLLAGYGPVVRELFWFTVGLVVVYVLGRLLFVPAVTRIVSSRNRNNPTIASATSTYLRVVLVGFAVLTGLVTAGYGNLLSNSAVVIAAITFVTGIAGQQVFGSLISGMFLVADPDFNVGDWIEWDGGQGTVEAVHFRVTRVRTPDNGTIAVPNTQLTGSSLTRPFGRDRYRVTEQVLVAYDEDTEHALLELRQTAEENEAVMAEPSPNTRVLELGPNAITLQAEFWIDDPMDRSIVTIRSDFRRRVKRRFDEEGLTIAPPSGQSLSGEIAVENRRKPSTSGGD
ncbi:mechanosensitive ion channel family protein [Halolamina sediminis]|jgi:small-conductance mechanosensitive channel|uniref:mechanosensitive ion channel family protein n=1 Tax=Halolamina sediminis TaxID=1480675 RepID=UPI0006B6459A|nr:mechanosensitive ion channel domain-containing protein [Halolamina sediminis]